MVIRELSEAFRGVVEDLVSEAKSKNGKYSDWVPIYGLFYFMFDEKRKLFDNKWGSYESLWFNWHYLASGIGGAYLILYLTGKL